MKTRLIAILRYLLACLETPAAAAETPDPVRDRVRALVAWADTFATGTSGEYKAHQVFARLQKEFPERRKRELRLLIELVLNEVAG